MTNFGTVSRQKVTANTPADGEYRKRLIMKFLIVLGWIFVPYIMIAVRWTKKGGVVCGIYINEL